MLGCGLEKRLLLCAEAELVSITAGMQNSHLQGSATQECLVTGDIPERLFLEFITWNKVSVAREPLKWVPGYISKKKANQKETTVMAKKETKQH